MQLAVIVAFVAGGIILMQIESVHHLQLQLHYDR